jgi:dihydroflavonol-4-reductase
MPAYVETGLNLVHVDDVAEGHLLAAERGRPGERYILGNRNMTLREILGLLATLTGLPAPRWRMPLGVALAAGYACEWWSDHVSRQAPRVPLEGVRMARKRMFFTAAKAVQELGLPQTPIDTALAEAIDWFATHGMAPGLAGRNVQAPESRRAGSTGCP